MSGEPVTIDADELLEAMTMSEELSCALDPKTGQVDIIPPFGDVWGDEEAPDLDDRLEIPRVEGREQYRWMEDFVRTLDDAPDIARQLDVALDGGGAFRRFRDVLDGHPDLQARWWRLRSERLLERAQAWLRAEELPHRLTVPHALREPAAQPAKPEAQPEVGLVHVLMLGAPGGKTELLAGQVHRTFVAPDTKEADRVLRRLVRHACALHGIAYRRSLVKGPGPVRIGEFEFERRGTTIEVRVVVASEVWRAFGPG